MKKITLILFILLLGIIVKAQTPTYTDSIYHIQIQTDILYGSTVNIFHLPQNLYMDMYSPVGLDDLNKPVIFLFHGGGFVSGSKAEGRLVELAKYYARCGYVVFLPDYRLGWKLATDTAKAIMNSHKAYYRAVQDGFTAIRYAKYYANILQLDTANFFVGGTSAGGMIAVGIGYLDQSEVDSYYTNQIKTSGNNLTKYESTEIKGVISYWGGMFDTTIFQGETVPNICFHGALDEVVYYNEGKYKGVIPIYGGYKVNKMCNDEGILSTLHTFPNNHHGVNVNSLQWDSCVNETKYWMANLINPQPLLKIEKITNNDETIYIYDISGREVYRGLEMPKDDILPNGIYLIKQDTNVYKKVIIH